MSQDGKTVVTPLYKQKRRVIIVPGSRAWRWRACGLMWHTVQLLRSKLCDLYF